MSSSAAPKSRRNTGFLGNAIEIARSVALVAAIALVPRVVLCEPYTIPSESMEPTLQIGDYVVISKFAYGWSRHSIPLDPPLGAGRIFGQSPKRGDIVVFKEPRNGTETIIKRLVGLPGDRMQVVGGTLLINGASVRRQSLASGLEEGALGETTPVARFRETLPNGRTYVTNSYGPDTAAANTGVYVVPAGCYFMMGDNRDNSADSRFQPGAIAPGQSSCPWNHDLDRFLPGQEGMGFVPFDDLVGRADVVVRAGNDAAEAVDLGDRAALGPLGPRAGGGELVARWLRSRAAQQQPEPHVAAGPFDPTLER